MRTTTVTAVAALLVLTAGLAGCGDDEDSDGGSSAADPVETQAAAILECTTEASLPGELTRTSEGVRAIDLTTSDQTIILHVHDSEDDAAAYDGDTLDFEVVGNVVVLGGAISDENRAIIDDCLDSNPI